MIEEYREFKRRCNIRLNEQQDKAVQTIDGPVLLLAVPGSGKTTVLVARLGYMIYVKGINPANILTVTYTVAATGDMKRRFISTFGDDFADEIEFRTINGICQKILSFYGKVTGKKPFDVADKETKEIIKMVYRNINKTFATENDIKNISTAISYIKNMRLSRSQIRKMDTEVRNFEEIYEAYNAQLKKRSLIDYDDQMVYALMILEKFPDVREYFQNLYKYICVDEAQDTSKIQHDIINLLAAGHGNLFMVGDEDQSIYGFRAAYPQGLLQFEQNHRNAQVLLMETNYRSNQEIVALADSFIQKNKYRHPKRMYAAREPGGSVRNIQFVNRQAQYNYILELARDCKEQTAILYRNNESAIPLIDMFERNDLDFRLKNLDTAFFSHPVVTDIIDILNFAISPFDGELFLRIYYKIGIALKKEYAYQMVDNQIGITSILSLAEDVDGMPYYTKKACREAEETLNSMASDTPGHAVFKILHVLDYYTFIEDRNMDTGKAEIIQILANNCSSINEFLNRLPRLQEYIENGADGFNANLVLSTIHSSKGLEYDRVYLMDMMDGIIPSSGVPGPRATEEDKKLYEEERRLFYVAMTRAKNQLNIFTYKNGSTSVFSKEVLKIQGPKPVASPSKPETRLTQKSMIGVYNRYADRR